MTTKLTGATITDDDIRELLRAALANEIGFGLTRTRILRACNCALGTSRGGSAAIRNARARCAEILNARNGSAS